MTKILNRVGMLISTVGQGTITAAVAISNKFLTPGEAGAVDGEQYYWLLEEGSDFEIFKGTWTASGTTISRDEVIASKISGTAGTTKMTLAGGATLRSALPKEGVAQGWTLIESITASGSSTQTFDNIPDAYTDLLITGDALNVVVGEASLEMEFSSNNGGAWVSAGDFLVNLSVSGNGEFIAVVFGSQLVLPLLVTSNGSLEPISGLSGRIDAIRISTTGVNFTGSLKLYGR